MEGVEDELHVLVSVLLLVAGEGLRWWFVRNGSHATGDGTLPMTLSSC